MSKKETTAVSTITVTDAQAAEITAHVMNLPTAGNFTLETSNYLKLEPGETYNFVCRGLTDGTDFNDKEKDVENGAVEIVYNGLTMKNQDAALLGTVKRMIQQGRALPCLLRVYVETEKRKNARGQEYLGMKIASAPITPEIMNALSA